MSHPFVETKEMTVGYRGVPLIRDIALHVHRGEILTLIGPNGSGKSTILKSLIRQLAVSYTHQMCIRDRYNTRAMREFPAQ